MKWLGLIILILNFTKGMGEVKAILFDCDGTLVDSEYAHYLGWKQALNDLGYDFKLDDYYQCVGKPAEQNAQLLENLVGLDCADYLVRAKREYYQTYCQAGLPPIEPTMSFLRQLFAEKEALGIKIGLCSAAKKGDILAHLSHLGIADLFDVVLSGHADLQEYSDPKGVNKPRPYIYLHAMKLLGVSPEETVVVEDSDTGSQAGVSAGCFTVAVPNEFTQHHDFSHTQWLLNSFADMTPVDFLIQVREKQSYIIR